VLRHGPELEDEMAGVDRGQPARSDPALDVGGLALDIAAELALEIAAEERRPCRISLAKTFEALGRVCDQRSLARM